MEFRVRSVEVVFNPADQFMQTITFRGREGEQKVFGPAGLPKGRVYQFELADN
jgi:hypothetical protein